MFNLHQIPQEGNDKLKISKMEYTRLHIISEFKRAISLRIELIDILQPFFNEFSFKFDFPYFKDVLLAKKLNKIGLLPNEVCSQIFNEQTFNMYFLDEKGNNNPNFDDNHLTRYGGELAKIIYHDDLEKLSLLSTQLSFDYNMLLPIENNILEYKQITLISYAAECKALKCFKFLLLNGASTMRRKNSHATCYFAAYAGQIEMIKILDDFDKSENDFIEEIGKASTKFHQNSILKWLLSVKNITQDHLNMFLYEASKWNNIKGLILLYKNGADINTIYEYFF